MLDLRDLLSRMVRAGPDAGRDSGKSVGVAGRQVEHLLPATEPPHPRTPSLRAADPGLVETPPVAFEIDWAVGLPERLDIAELILEGTESLGSLPAERFTLLQFAGPQWQDRGVHAREVRNGEHRLHEFGRAPADRVTADAHAEI